MASTRPRRRGFSLLVGVLSLLSAEGSQSICSSTKNIYRPGSLRFRLGRRIGGRTVGFTSATGYATPSKKDRYAVVGATEEDLDVSWKMFKGVESTIKQEWYSNLQKLRDYKNVYGDCALGFRDDDDKELVAWVKEQRQENLKGNLDRVQKAELDALEFHWKNDYFDDQAEWLEMFNELKQYLGTYGTLEISPISSISNQRLMHWTHVQRELAGGGILPVKRRAMLDSLGFEFDGPAGSNH